MKLKDIAKIANVSPATVSLVLKNKQGVSQQKRESITKLLIENGYSIAEQNPANSTKNIRFLKYTKHGMLIDGNPNFITSIMDAVEFQTRSQNYNLLMTSFNSSQIDEVTKTLHEDPADGVILLGTELDKDDLPFLHSITTPLVVVDNLLPTEDISCVTMQNRSSILQSVSYLYKLGHREIGYVANAYPSCNCSERFGAYKEALHVFGLTYQSDLVFSTNPTAEGAYQTMYHAIKNKIKLPSAIIANNDTIAIGCMKAFNEFGIRVPDDLSLIGFDNISFSSMSCPPLSTQSVSCTDMGIWAVRILTDKIKNSKSPSVKIQVGTELIVRESTRTIQG